MYLGYSKATSRSSVFGLEKVGPNELESRTGSEITDLEAMALLGQSCVQCLRVGGCCGSGLFVEQEGVSVQVRLGWGRRPHIRQEDNASGEICGLTRGWGRDVGHDPVAVLAQLGELAARRVWVSLGRCGNMVLLRMRLLVRWSKHKI